MPCEDIYRYMKLNDCVSPFISKNMNSHNVLVIILCALGTLSRVSEYVMVFI